MIGQGIFEHLHNLSVETAELDKVNHLVTLQQDSICETIKVAGLKTACSFLLHGMLHLDRNVGSSVGTRCHSVTYAELVSGCVNCV